MVSIIIPVYNAEAFIKDTIQSVICQTFTDWELILVDDCSTDGSVGAIEEVIGSGNPKIRLMHLIEGGSAAKARNAGIEVAQGRYIAFLDADDIWYKDKLQKQLDFIETLNSQGTKAGFVFTAYEFGDENARPNGRMTIVPEKLTFRKALSRTVIFTSTVLIDTKVIDKKLILMPQIASEDTATWWGILKAGFTAYGINEPMVIYRRPQNSLSSNKKVAIKRIWDLYRQVAGLNIIWSTFYLIQWAFRATFRRVVPRNQRRKENND